MLLLELEGGLAKGELRGPLVPSVLWQQSFWLCLLGVSRSSRTSRIWQQMVWLACSYAQILLILIVPISLYSCKWCVVKVAWHGNINWSPDPTTKQTCCDQKVHIKIQICSPGKEITPSKTSTPCVSKTSCQPKTELELYFCNDFVGVLTPNEMSPPPLYTYKGLWWIEGIQSIKNTIIILFLPFQSSYLLFHKHLDDVYGRSR